MKLFKRLIHNNTFIFNNGQVRQISAQQNENSASTFEDALLPIVIIAREHFQEIEREYPVPDKKDVRNIIDNEFQSLKMVRIESKDLTTSTARIFTFDAVSEAFVQKQLCIYIPETLLSQFLPELELTTVERLGQPLNLIRKGDVIYSSSGAGLYQNPQLFLASSGVGEANSTKALNEGEYFELILNQLVNLKSAELLMVFGGQTGHKRLFESLHMPSIGIGIAASIFVYWGLLWGHLKWTEEFSTTDYSSADVKAVIQSKQNLEANIALYNELNSASTDVVSGKVIWQMVTNLLESDVSVGSLLFQDGELKLNLLAASATEAIKLVRSFSNVENVIMDGDIYNLQGKQSVVIIIQFRKEASDV